VRASTATAVNAAGTRRSESRMESPEFLAPAAPPQWVLTNGRVIQTRPRDREARCAC
jgi:hypothetical protein